MARLSLLCLFAAAGAALSTGCATSPDTTDDDAVVGDDAEVRAAQATCTPEKYNEAFGHYRKAVYGAKDRLRGEICGEEDTFLWSIAGQAAASVMTCAAFKDVIKTSPYAEPLRTVLADSLTLKSLTGELLVLRDSQWANWSGVERLLPGTSFSTEPQGAMGWHTTIKLGANGAATYVTMEELDAEPWVKFHESPARYRVEKTGAEKDPRRVVIEHDGKTEVFQLRVADTEQGNFSSAPVFQLVPPGANPSHLWETFNSLVGECDA